MLALLGFATIGLFILLVMTNRLSAVVALITVPVLAGLIGGFGMGLGDMMIAGIVQSAPTAAMLVFALLYFLVMYEAGMFEPFIAGILKIVGEDPLKIVLGTVALIIIAGFDGDGATAVLITITAMFPIYRKVGLNPLIMAMLLGLILPILNWLPWGGPAARAAVALDVPLETIVGPMIPALILCLLAIVGLAWWFGLRERRRLTALAAAGGSALGEPEDPKLLPKPREVITPRNFWFNIALTIGVMVCLALGLAPLPAVIMVAFAIAATVNYPNVDKQQERLKAHGGTALMLFTLILAAGAFTGIIDETGMVAAMSESLVSVIPESWGPYFGFITGLLSMPLLVFMSTDSFFFGVVPILGQTGAAYGVPPEVIARAAMIGMPCHSLSPLIAPIYFVATLLRTDIGKLQRFAWHWTIALSLFAMAALAATGAIWVVT